MVKIINGFILSLFLLFFLSCSSYKKVQKNEYTECPILVSVKFVGDPVTIIITNLSNDTIKASNPSYNANASFKILDKNQNLVDIGQKIHPVIRESRRDLLTIFPYDSISVKYDHKLNNLFVLKRGELYTIELNYIGDVFKDGRLCYCRNLSFTKRVIW